MAVTKIWPVRDRFDKVLDYAANAKKTDADIEKYHALDGVIDYAADGDKTEKCFYVSGVNCLPENVKETFAATQKRYGKTTGELSKATKRLEMIPKLLKKIYEDNAGGLVTDEDYMILSREYNEERTRVKDRIVLLQEKLKDLDDRRYERDKFVRAIRRFMEMKVLTKNLLTELIDRIEVHETEGVGKNRTQRVVIYYRFVGYLEIPNEQTRFSEDTRQGATVTYISCAPIKVRYGDDREECEEGG